MKQIEGKMSSSSSFFSLNVRLRNDFLTLEYQNNKPLFKSIRQNTSHLSKMGIKRKDGHFLTIEETLYLTEIGAAIVVDQKGNKLTISQLYALLGNLHISLLKYTVFVKLVKAGYIVRKSLQNKNEKGIQQSLGYSVKLRNFQFPKELMDQFPCVYSLKTPGPFSLRLHLPQININSEFTSLFKSDSESENIQLEELNNQMAKKVKNFEFKLLSNIRRFDREPWECLRPKYWPSFHTLRSCENWVSYQIRREALLQNLRNRRGNKRERREEERESPFYDYEVFNKNINEIPLYRILVIDNRFSSDYPTFSEIEYLIEMSKQINKNNNYKLTTISPLLIVYGTPTCLQFIKVIFFLIFIYFIFFFLNLDSKRRITKPFCYLK
ncbi:hypothetical protein Mgra_00000194 [Meloidogyne graminicola]|uniref:tRNA-splicing endonuclease subunit Sen54 N-terminal domain-containing protein n=1 Tax=Meloidogyne graminicola TaxID=189291 RepID=A0A8T0A4B3_9BILA|nr:hypothetical protein Mgra_00000194 [Meloidogyne graminicola]